ncbi:GntR family transcriptional regulator [Euzebya sp.]|uniref:GntR family transcriptional regulator n=1 Tax=Euzebya sp. TaxID=1971409 RepID=UPI0035199E63
MLLQLDEGDPRPLYAQIAAAIRRQVAARELVPGDRLPSGRDLAEASGVTLETVQRAYRVLVDEGVVVSRVGRGTTVADGVDPATLSLADEVDALVRSARALAVDLDDVLAEVRRRWTAPS